MSGKNGISKDKTVFLSLLAGETRLCSDKSPMLPLPGLDKLYVGSGNGPEDTTNISILHKKTLLLG